MSHRSKKAQNPTIVDVAVKAGLSKSTVSRFINNQKGISDNAACKIEEVISAIGYKPNSVARALKLGGTKTIGLIIPSVQNSVFAPLVKTIENAAMEAGFTTILCNTDGQVQKELKYLDLLTEKRVDGILFNAMGEFHPKFAYFATLDIPMLVIGKKIPGFNVPNVTVNNEKGALLAVEHLIRTGMRRIAFFFGPHESASAIHDRFEGYKRALQTANLSLEEELLINCADSYNFCKSSLLRLIEGGERFDSIFAANDGIAIECENALIEMGYKIPGDISVFGYDDIPESRIVRPSLSTVLNPVEDFGLASVQSLLVAIKSKRKKLFEKVFDPKLIIRESTRSLSYLDR